MKLIRKTKIENINYVYNLHIRTDHNYLAENLVVSNCHGAKAEKLQSLLSDEFAHCPIRWGMTGTIPTEKHQAYTLTSTIGTCNYTLKAKELQDKGILANCNVNIVQLKEDKRFGNWQEELKYLVTNTERLKWMSKFIHTVSQSGNTLVLVDRVVTGEELCKLIPNSAFVYGDTKGKERTKEYKDINTGNNGVLIASFGVAAVGINIPRIFNLVLIEPGKSFIKVIQSIGRGIRVAEDKDFVNIYDLCSATKYSKNHLTQRKKYYKDAQYPFVIEKVDWN